ncbi:MAG: FecR protein [Gemmatimonadetes bacterium]|nr:FecR protein [Gemmatimonadota bacterium]
MTNHGSDHGNSANAPAPDWDAIARFLAGESPAEEATSVRQWLEAHPEDRELVEHLSAAAVFVEPATDVDVERALQSVHARMSASDARPRLTLERGGSMSRGRRAFTVGALTAAAAAFVAFVTVRRGPAIVGPQPSAAAHTYSTAVGQRDSITLADGSRVILGPDSRLTVPGDYAITTRTVALQGDGYFDVRHDPTKPFAVHVGRALVEDVGTTFTVESDAGDTTTVSVLSGSVRLRPAGSSPTAGAVLAAGDRGALTADGQVHAFPHAGVADDAAWTSGRLVFHEASLTRVAGEIRRWYGVNVHVADSSLLDRHVTASFNGESVDQVLKIISLTLGARVERQGDSATVYSSRVPAIQR